MDDTTNIMTDTPPRNGKGQRVLVSKDLLGIVIERGIPAPYKRGTMRRVLEKMNVGESFTVPTEKLRNAVIQAAKYSRMETVSEKINGGGYRIWLLKK